ncbi:MAG: hypothetical protein JWQ39_1053 [Glaciihabitans sp.]|nr:hypothetical protein [Glaciihabitans sp.]
MLELAIALIGGCALFVLVTLLALVATRRIGRERTGEVAYADLVALSEYVSTQPVEDGAPNRPHERPRRRGPRTDGDHPQLAAVLRALEGESNS